MHFIIASLNHVCAQDLQKKKTEKNFPPIRHDQYILVHLFNCKKESFTYLVQHLPYIAEWSR